MLGKHISYIFHFRWFRPYFHGAFAVRFKGPGRFLPHGFCHHRSHGAAPRLEPKPLPRPTKLLRRGRRNKAPGGSWSFVFFVFRFRSFLGKVKRVQKNSSGKFPNDKHLYIKLFERFGSGICFCLGRFLWKFQKIFQTLTSKVACVFLASMLLFSSDFADRSWRCLLGWKLRVGINDSELGWCLSSFGDLK